MRYASIRNSLSTKTSGKYTSECSFHLERTLDEAYYPGISAEDLERRNEDQVVSRKRHTAAAPPDETAPILMVPQLWLWRMGNVVVSATSMTRDSKGPSKKFSPRKDQYDAGWEHRLRTNDPHFLMASLIAEQIEAFGRECEVNGNKFLPPLDIFESSVVSVLVEVDTYIKKTQPSEAVFEKERRFLHSLSDAQSELVMIQDVLEQQKSVLSDILKDRTKGVSREGNGVNEPQSRWNQIETASTTIEMYERRIKKISGDAERVEKAVKDMLELKRTYASVKDAHSSLLLSTAVIGFTVITIVFAPLAFLTALFALKIEGFEALQVKGKDGVYASGKMGGVFGK